MEWLRAELDDDVPEDEAERAAVEAAFRRAVSCELAFFEAAYQR